MECDLSIHACLYSYRWMMNKFQEKFKRGRDFWFMRVTLPLWCLYTLVNMKWDLPYLKNAIKVLFGIFHFLRYWTPHKLRKSRQVTAKESAQAAIIQLSFIYQTPSDHYGHLRKRTLVFLHVTDHSIRTFSTVYLLSHNKGSAFLQDFTHHFRIGPLFVLMVESNLMLSKEKEQIFIDLRNEKEGNARQFFSDCCHSCVIHFIAACE